MEARILKIYFVNCLLLSKASTLYLRLTAFSYLSSSTSVKQFTSGASTPFMKVQEIISEIADKLNSTYNSIDKWFEKEESLRDYKPSSHAWSVNQILEHIVLTNHFLLILIDKATRKALQNSSQVEQGIALQEYNFQRSKLDEVGLHKSFEWIRPEHMEPKGERSLMEIRTELKSQFKRCLEVLEKLPNGEGAFYKTTMSVNNLGKIDVYEYIYFLAQHGQRHVTQMEKNEAEFRGNASS